jgi:hypothetical protein
MLAALHANAEKALARAEAATAAELEARRRAEVATADVEARFAQLRDDLERVSRERQARFTAEQIAREKAEAEAAQLRQENQARRDRGLLARLRTALRRE